MNEFKMSLFLAPISPVKDGGTGQIIKPATLKPYKTMTLQEVKPALTALVILAIPPILIQTTLAFSQVPDFLLEVADAMGMDKKRKFRQVEVPLAMPGIISGIRMAMSEVIASATLAAYIGAGGLGILIFNGINLLKTEYLVIGGGTVAVITMLCSMALGAVEKKISRAL